LPRNTLTYFTATSVSKKKSFIILTPDLAPVQRESECPSKTGLKELTPFIGNATFALLIFILKV